MKFNIQFFVFCVSALMMVQVPVFAADPLPPGYCYKKCDGTAVAKPPFDFWGKVSTAGDPNTGRPLRRRMRVPREPGSSATKQVDSKEFFDQLTEFEKWSAGECGENLNDPSETVQVIGPCYGDRLKNTWTVNVISSHSKTGTPPPSIAVIDAFFKAATTPEQKKAKDEFPWARRGGAKTAFKKCWPKDVGAGTKDTFGVYIMGNLCADFQAPPLPGGVSVVKGIPAESKTSVTADGKAGVYVLGGDLTLARANAKFYSPRGTNVERSAQAYVLGAKLYDESDKGTDVSWNYKLDLGSYKKGVSATFTIGPIPITVEAGAAGKAGVNFMARLTDMWANGRVQPFVDSAAYASGYINAFIAQAGVEAFMTLLKDTLDLYGFVGVVVGQANGLTQFVFTTQVAGENSIEALNGHVDIFARIRVPKFIGWKWKTYSTELFRWGGVSTKGYLFSYMLANQPIATFVNNEE